jgi:hypothetical protein
VTTPKIAPAMVSKWDVVSPPWNPRILLTCSGLVRETTLASAIPDHNPNVPGDTPVVIVYGIPDANPSHLILSEPDRLWLIRPGRKAG